MTARSARCALLSLLLPGLPLISTAAEHEETGPCSMPIGAEASPTAEPADGLQLEPEPAPATSPTRRGTLGSILGGAKRCVQDTGAFFTAPLHWDATGVRKAVGFGAI